MRNSIYLALACTFVFILSLQRFGNGDLLWHIRLGELALDSGHFPRVDTFSHTMLGQPMALHSPLFDLIVAYIFRLGNWPTLTLFTAAVKTFLFYFFWRSVRRLGVRETSIWVAVGVFWLAAPQLYPPQLFSFLLFVVLLNFMPLASKTRRTDMLLAGSFVLIWPMFHPSFPLGIAMLILYGFCEPRRSLSWFMTAAVCAAVISWLFPSAFEDVWNHANSSVLKENVGQWRSLLSVVGTDWYSKWIVLNLFVLSVGAVVIFVKDRHKSTRVALYTLVLVTAVMGYSSVRFFPLFVFSAAPLLIVAIQNEVAAAIYGGLFTLCYVLNSQFSPGLSLDTRKLPVDCVAFLKAHPVPGEMFNSYTFGSYLIYEVGATQKVFVDPRATQLYPDAFLSSFLQAYEDPKIFEQLVSQYHVGYTFLKSDSGRTGKLIDYLNASPRWKQVYTDPSCTIHRVLR